MSWIVSVKDIGGFKMMVLTRCLVRDSFFKLTHPGSWLAVERIAGMHMHMHMHMHMRGDCHE